MQSTNYDDLSMNTSIRPLYITPLVYQHGNINAEINSAFIDSLPTNYSPVVLCGENTFRCTDKNKILNVKSCPFVKSFLRIKLKFIKDGGMLPDGYYYIWYKKAIEVAKKYIYENHVDFIHSFSFPYSSHLVALELKKKYGIPWIAHFYEPWGDNPYRRISNLVISKNSAWENEVVKTADIIIHNSDIMCQSWRNRYGDMMSNKLFSLPMPFAFKGCKLSTPKYDSLSKMRITHVGNFYGLRKAEPFLRAMSALLEKKPHFRDKLKVVFVGEMLSDDIDFIISHKLNDVIEIVGRKSEEECVDYYKQANIFLVIEGKDQGALFFPSKLIQYYYYNRPIVGLTQEGSVLWNELESTGHKVYRQGDEDGLKEYIETALLNYESLLSYNHDSWKRFEPKNVADKYLNILNKHILVNN